MRADQWRNAAGDFVGYLFWYHEQKVIEVEAKYCKAAIVEKYRCVRSSVMPHDENRYSLTMRIKKVEPVDQDFKVFVEIENNGEKPVLIGVNGELVDGSPELWVLGVEQEEDSEWSSVGCSLCRTSRT